MKKINIDQRLKQKEKIRGNRYIKNIQIYRKIKRMIELKIKQKKIVYE